MFFMMSWDSKADSAVSPEHALIFFFFKNQFSGNTRYPDLELWALLTKQPSNYTKNYKAFVLLLFNNSQIKDDKEITHK